MFKQLTLVPQLRSAQPGLKNNLSPVNNSGVIFLTVLMILLTMAVLVINIISMNTSQVMLSEGEVKRIQEENLAMGAFSYTFANQMSPSASNSISYSRSLDHIPYTVQTKVSPGKGMTPYDTDYLNDTVKY